MINLHPGSTHILTTSFPSHTEDVSTLAERVRPDEISVEVGSKTLTLGVALVAVCKDRSDSSPENLLRPRWRKGHRILTFPCSSS
eukprot:1142184-Pelagomonas_calceolata.AAC.1